MMPWVLVLTGLLLLLLVTQAVTHLLIKREFGRASYPEQATTAWTYEDYADDYPRERFSFMSGPNRLQGYIYGPENTRGLLVLAHGIGTGHEGYIDEIIWFVDRGWRVLSYDATGSCTSEGKGTRGLPQSALDLHAALTTIEADPTLSALPRVLLGHSWGGYAVTAVLNYDHEVQAVASLSAYSEPMEMMASQAKTLLGRFAPLVKPFMWLDSVLLFGRSAQLSAYEGVNTSGIPVFIAHGTADELIRYDGVALINKRDRIHNPLVRYLSLSAHEQNGHNTIFRDASALPAIRRFNAQYEELALAHDGEMPPDIREAFIAMIDKPLVNRANEELMTTIEGFYREALETRN